MTVKEAASLWNITERRVADYCKAGRIRGAKKVGRSWIIPLDSEKPEDQRIKSGMYAKKVGPDKLPLPIGIEQLNQIHVCPPGELSCEASAASLHS